MSHTIQITSINQEELGDLIKNSIVEALQNWQPILPLASNLPEYSTRKEVAVLLRISLPTLDDYIKRGVIEAERIGGRIRIRSSEIENAMTKVKSLRYKRK